MPKNNPEDLFQLIKSLTKSEKGYFKKFVSAHAKGEVIYLRLFDAMDKQKEYDEKKTCEKAGIIKPELLKRTKHYLYHLILKSLDLYHADHAVDNTIRRLLTYSELLYNKGLHRQSYTTLKKCKALAYKYEKYILLPSILHLQIRFAFQLKDPKMLQKNIIECSAETEPVFEKARDLIGYVTLSLRLTALQRLEGLDYTRGKGLSQLKGLTQSPLMKDEHRPSSYASKLAFYNLSSTYNLTIQKPELALKYELKKLQYMESHPHQIKEFTYAYIAALNNLHNTQCRLKKFADARQTLEKMRTIPQRYSIGKKEINKIEIFSFYYTDALDLYNKMGKFEKSLAMVPAVEKGLAQFKDKMRKEMLVFIHFNIAVAYFGLKQFKKSLLWLNKILNQPEQETMRLVYSITKMLNLLIHYELKREDYLESLTRSSRRYLVKREQLFEVEKTMLHFMGKKLPLIDKEQHLNKAFRELKTKLQSISKNPQEAIPLQELDLIAWVESKIEKKSYAEIVRKKAEKFY